MMDAVRSAIDAYNRIDPRDMRDAEFHCSPATFEELLKSAGFADTTNPSGIDRLFGRPIRINKLVPDGTVIAIAETEMDRMLRRAARDHLSVNVIRPASVPDPLVWPAPVPDSTLGALLRHWWSRLKKILKKLVDISASSR